MGSSAAPTRATKKEVDALTVWITTCFEWAKVERFARDTVSGIDLMRTEGDSLKPVASWSTRSSKERILNPLRNSF